MSSLCDNCGRTAPFTPTFAPTLQVWRCGRCQGFSYRGALETPAEQLYDRSYFHGGEYIDYAASLPAQRRNFERKLRLLADVGLRVGAETRALELGCASGAFLGLLRERGARHLLGVEVSAYARELAARDGVRVLPPTAPELDRLVADLRPDLVVAWDVWEHLPAPATIFARHLTAADPRAIVALTTVDAGSAVARLRGARWRQFHPPTHLHYPTRASLRLFFEDRSMPVLLQHSFGYHRPALEYLQALGLQRLVASNRRLREHPVYLNLWDTQLVVAKGRA